MRITIVVAAAENGVIGRNGKIPWRIPEDLKRFKAMTTGHTVIMGRKTWESLGRALPDRVNVVVTRQKGYRAEGATVVGSIDAALANARSRNETEAFIVGGGEIYEQTLPRAHRVELTRVHSAVEGDAFFPPVEMPWREVKREAHEQVADAQKGLASWKYTFITYEKPGKA